MLATAAFLGAARGFFLRNMGLAGRLDSGPRDESEAESDSDSDRLSDMAQLIETTVNERGCAKRSGDGVWDVGFGVVRVVGEQCGERK